MNTCMNTFMNTFLFMNTSVVNIAQLKFSQTFGD